MQCPNCGGEMIQETYDGGDPPVYEPSVCWKCVDCGYTEDQDGEEV